MNAKYIQQLIERYFAGESSLQEEAELRHYFAEGPVAPELEVYAAFFGPLREKQQIRLPDSFEQELLEQLPPRNTARVRRLPLRQWMVRVAAVLLLAAGVWYIYPRQAATTETAGIDWSKYEPDNPEEALRIYRSALQKVGGTMNQGASTAAQNVDKFKEIGKFFK